MSSVLAENILLYLTLFYLLFQSLKLQAVISGIHVVHVQKLLMCTALFDSVFTDHDDLIRISDRRKTMGNGNACTVFCQMFETFLNMTFTFVIQCTGRFIENQDLRILQKDSRYRNALFCPPLRRVPRSPTYVSYPCGRLMIKSCMFAFFAASMISSRVAPGFPYAIFSPILPVNR